MTLTLRNVISESAVYSGIMYVTHVTRMRKLCSESLSDLSIMLVNSSPFIRPVTHTCHLSLMTHVSASSPRRLQLHEPGVAGGDGRCERR